jgi:hypothetical protein
MSFLFLRIPWEREKPLGHQRLWRLRSLQRTQAAFQKQATT